jgi:hypothetical protein
MEGSRLMVGTVEGVADASAILLLKLYVMFYFLL